MKALFDFLKSFDETPVQWGLNDCSAINALWLARLKGIRVEFPFYETKEQAHEIIAAHGGLTRVYDEFLAPHGLPEVAEPACGDIGVVQMTDMQIGVIFANAGVAYWRREDVGFHQFRPRPRYIAKIWSVQ